MSDVTYDLHTHTTYSDGHDMAEMAEAAGEVGLDGIGFSDHCLAYHDPFGRRDRYDLVETYQARREEIQNLETDVEVFDAAEMNYDPSYEGAIREFLTEADFAYTVGSVHYAGEYDVNGPSGLADASATTKREAVETYIDWQVQLVESELFDVMAHIDLPQRSPVLRGVIEPDDYQRLADALDGSGTVPEINAGRLERDYGTVHPDPDFFDVFRDAGVPFVIGTDSHNPEQVRERIERLRPIVEEHGIEVVDVP